MVPGPADSCYKSKLSWIACAWSWKLGTSATMMLRLHTTRPTVYACYLPPRHATPSLSTSGFIPAATQLRHTCHVCTVYALHMCAPVCLLCQEVGVQHKDWEHGSCPLTCREQRWVVMQPQALRHIGITCHVWLVSKQTDVASGAVDGWHASQLLDAFSQAVMLGSGSGKREPGTCWTER